jgi:AraC-like DNA-binding protein
MVMTKRWIGRIFLRPGRLLYAGMIGPTQPHMHHAFQIARGLSGPIRLVGPLGERLDAAAAVIPPDTHHGIAGATQSGWLMYLDPDDQVGQRLRSATKDRPSPLHWAEAAQPLRNIAAPLPQRWEDVERLERAVLDALAVSVGPPRSLHPAVGRALQVIGENLNSDVSLTAVAAAAHLSPSRLSHLFSSEIGIPLRRYVLWRRLIRAASAVQNGASWTEAAHAGGFSDSSHMNRTFRRMFGLAPTDVHRDVEWTTAATEPASLAH